VAAEVLSAAVSPDGRKAVIGLSGRTAVLVNLASGVVSERPVKLHWFSRAAGFAARGRVACGTVGSAQAESWDAVTGGKLRKFEQPPARGGHFYLLSFAVSPYGRHAASSHSDGGPAVYETATGQVLAHSTHFPSARKRPAVFSTFRAPSGLGNSHCPLGQACREGAREGFARSPRSSCHGLDTRSHHCLDCLSSRKGIRMALQSQLFRGDPKLESAAVSDPAHIVLGARGPHVGKIQLALIQLDGSAISQDSAFGPATAAAVSAFKRKRQILNLQGVIDDIVGKKTMSALDDGMLALEKRGRGLPDQWAKLVLLINELAGLLQPAQRGSFTLQANALVPRSALVGGGTDANSGAIPLVGGGTDANSGAIPIFIVLFVIILFMIAITAQSQNPATKQMGREWAKRFARLKEQIRGKPVEVQNAKTLEETRQMGKDVAKNAQDERQKCLDRLSPEKLTKCANALRKLSEALQSLALAVAQGLGQRGATEQGIMARIGRAAQDVFAASRAAAECTGCDNMVL